MIAWIWGFCSSIHRFYHFPRIQAAGGWPYFTSPVFHQPPACMVHFIVHFQLSLQLVFIFTPVFKPEEESGGGWLFSASLSTASSLSTQLHSGGSSPYIFFHLFPTYMCVLCQGTPLNTEPDTMQMDTRQPPRYRKRGIIGGYPFAFFFIALGQVDV